VANKRRQAQVDSEQPSAGIEAPAQPPVKRARAGKQDAAPASSTTAHGARASLEALRAAFVSALPGIAAAASAASENAATLNRDFASFVAGSPPIDELEKGCRQYLEYARQDAAASCGLEAPCRQFLDYLRDLRPESNAAAGTSERADTSAAANAPGPSCPSAQPHDPAPAGDAVAGSLADAPPTGPHGPSWQIVVDAVQWHSASDASKTVADLRVRAVSTSPLPPGAPRSGSLELRGAPVDAHDSDTISAEAARALAGGLASCRGTLTALALTDMKLSTGSLRTLLSPLAGSASLRRVDLSSLCSRWTEVGTATSKRPSWRGRGWPPSQLLGLRPKARGCPPHS